MKPNWKKLRSGELDWEIFHLRARVFKEIRRFFEKNDFIEIEAPVLTPYPTLDNNIHSIETQICDNTNCSYTMFLHTSPEHAMKKLLAAGARKIYFLGKVFRNRELTPLHNPEFTMVEWYRTSANYGHIQKDIENIIIAILQETHSTMHMEYRNNKKDLTRPRDRISMTDLFQEYAQLNLENCLNLYGLQEAAQNIGIPFGKNEGWETLFFRIFIEKIEPHLGFPRPTFVVDYPAQLGLMAQRKENNSEWVERVELYIGGLELANGYSELVNPDEQRDRFIAELEKKQDEGYPHYPIDEELIESLNTGIPPCAGIALGVDRLIMLLTGKTNIHDVILFPFCQIKENMNLQ